MEVESTFILVKKKAKMNMEVESTFILVKEKSKSEHGGRVHVHFGEKKKQK